MSYKDFFDAYVNNDLGSSVFLYGAEDFLIEWARDLIISKYVDEAYRDFDVVKFDGSNANFADIADAARAYSMFSEKRVVVINNYPSIYKKVAPGESADDDALLELAAEKQDSSVLIFALESKYYDELKAYGKKLASKCQSYEFTKLDRNELRSWINKRLHAEGKMIGRKEMEYLIDVSGYCFRNSEYDLKNFAGDISKLCGASEDEMIQLSLIDELMVGADDKFVFNYIDALMSGNKANAMEMAANILRDDDAAMQLLSLLTKQFEIMYDSLQLSEEGMSLAAMAKTIGINEYRLKKAFQAARGFSRARLRELIIELYNIDKDIKSGNIDRNIAFELFTSCV